MILADKIILLRKSYGWSQESLADALEVSRQSVSKWESNNSMPDLNKILKIGEIFGVSTDYLLKDEIDDLQIVTNENDIDLVKLSMEQVNYFISEKEKRYKLISKGIILCFYALIPLFIMLGLLESQIFNIGEGVVVLIGISLMLIMVIAGITCFIVSNQNNNSVEKLVAAFELRSDIEVKIREKLLSFQLIYNRNKTISVVLLIVSVVPLVYSKFFNNLGVMPIFMLGVMFALIGIAVFILIRINAQKNIYEVLLKVIVYPQVKNEEKKLLLNVGLVYWPVVAAIYIGWSFITHDWHISWLLWPVAVLLFVSLYGVIQLVSLEKR